MGLMEEREHDALLATLADSPGDDGAWYVYADWLEEQGDPLADLIREHLQSPWTMLRHLMGRLTGGQRRQLITEIMRLVGQNLDRRRFASIAAMVENASESTQVAPIWQALLLTVSANHRDLAPLVPESAAVSSATHPQPSGVLAEDDDPGDPPPSSQSLIAVAARSICQLALALLRQASQG